MLFILFIIYFPLLVSVSRDDSYKFGQLKYYTIVNKATKKRKAIIKKKEKLVTNYN